MNAETRKLLDKAARAVSAADRLPSHGDPDFAAGRAYHAMFYAELHERNLRSRNHSGVHSLFGTTFAETGTMDARYHRWLLDAFDKRLQADYAFDMTLTGDDASEMIAPARELLDCARRLLP